MRQGLRLDAGDQGVVPVPLAIKRFFFALIALDPPKTRRRLPTPPNTRLDETTLDFKFAY
jgi:hypothetical protein